MRVEAAVNADQCTTECTDGSTTYKCGGPKGLISVYDTFKAFSTLDLYLEATNLLNESISTTESDVSDASAPVSTGEVYIRSKINLNELAKP